jgi:hypothetical protein
VVDFDPTLEELPVQVVAQQLVMEQDQVAAQEVAHQIIQVREAVVVRDIIHPHQLLVLVDPVVQVL